MVRGWLVDTPCKGIQYKDHVHIGSLLQGYYIIIQGVLTMAHVPGTSSKGLIVCILEGGLGRGAGCLAAAAGRLLA